MEHYLFTAKKGDAVELFTRVTDEQGIHRWDYQRVPGSNQLLVNIK